MHKISILDRILLLATGMLAAYHISLGLNGLNPLSTWSYTVGFGVLLVASLLLLILGFESLESQAVVIISTVIPLGIALGLVADHLPQYSLPFLIFAVMGLTAVGFTRYLSADRTATIVLAITHGVAGSLITILPVILSFQGKTSPEFLLVGLGGALIGVGGLLLAFLKAGKPLLSQQTIYRLLPVILFLMSLSFIVGFSLT
jgi:hypothetical protein